MVVCVCVCVYVCSCVLTAEGGIADRVQGNARESTWYLSSPRFLSRHRGHRAGDGTILLIASLI